MVSNYSRMLLGVMALLSSSCDKLVVRAPDEDSPKAKVEITSAVASECEPSCRFITIEISVKNEGRGLLCVPSIYQSRLALSATYFEYTGGGDRVLPTTDGSPNIFYTHNPLVTMSSLSAGPMYVVGQGKQINMRIDFKNKEFILKNNPAISIIRFSTFECSYGESGSQKISVLDLRKNVEFFN